VCQKEHGWADRQAAVASYLVDSSHLAHDFYLASLLLAFFPSQLGHSLTVVIASGSSRLFRLDLSIEHIPFPLAGLFPDKLNADIP